MRPRLPVLAVLLVIDVASPMWATSPPAEVRLPEGSPGYFRSDHYTGAQYLQLSTDGRYNIVGVEHMGRFEIDRGTWSAEGAELFLRSDDLVLDVVEYPFRVYVGRELDVELLPELRRRVFDLYQIRGNAPLELADVKELKVSHERGADDRSVAVTLDLDVEIGRRTLKPDDLLELIKALDDYLAQPELRNVFPYRSFDYRGQTFLLPLEPGATAVDLSVSSIQEEIDEDPTTAPPYVFVAIPEATFRRGTERNYPFKYFPELNEPSE